MSFSSSRAVGDPESEKKWPFCCRGLCLPQLYPSCFSFAVREKRSVTVRGFAAATTTAFLTTISAAQKPTLTSLEPWVEAHNWVLKMYQDKRHCKLRVTSLKIWTEYSSPTSFKQLGGLQITRQITTKGHKDMGPNLKVFTIKNRIDVQYIDFTINIDSCPCSLPFLPAAHFSSEFIFLF